MQTHKKALRTRILKQRQALSAEKRNTLSRQIINKLITNFIGPETKNIMAYLPFKGEVDTYPLIHYCLDAGIGIYLPRTNKDEKTMEPVRIADVQKDLIKGNYGIYEPHPDLKEKATIDTLQLIVVPGVAYDRKCYRLGFGGGYYDRFLAERPPSTQTVASAYSFQVLDDLPCDNWDEPVNAIVTEEEIIVS